MAEPVKMQIEYYPARKSVRFVLYEADGTIVKNTDKMNKYSVEQKGKFVLPLHGKDFFDDILEPFAGKTSVPVHIKTTRADYDDFRLMVDAYNKSIGKERIKLGKFTKASELLDMAQVYTNIKASGEKMADLLDKASVDIPNITCKSDSSRTYINKVAQRIKGEANKIKEKLASLDDNTVNLCFIGVFSSGKSTLINALLGYRILPTSLLSKTAIMMQIRGVPCKEDSYIEFGGKELEERAKICWDKGTKVLTFKDCTLPAELCSKIKGRLEESRGKELHEQFYSCLDYLNGKEIRKDICSLINIGFPIPLDGKGLKFIITDTPGTDSNYSDHKRVLDEALSRQDNSISIFVIKPDGFEGSGNSILLREVLKQQKEKRNYLDMEQSFFVVNRMDDYDPAGYVLASQSIIAKNDSIELSDDVKPIDKNDSIELSDTKLFFLSSEIALMVRANKNGSLNDADKKSYKRKVPNCYDEDDPDLGRYYTHNHLGRSQSGTERMRKDSATVLSHAEKKNDDYMKYLVSSGFYSLEQEIKSYGHRHAVAVKACALLQGMEEACKSVSDMVLETKLGTDDNIKDINKNLQEEIDKVNGIINTTKAEFSAVSPDIKRQLGIDSDSFMNNVIKPVENDLKENLHKFLLLFRVNVDEQLKDLIHEKVSGVERNYKDLYRAKRMRKLEDVRTNFISKFIEGIKGDDSISDEVRKHLANFTQPEIPPMGIDGKIGNLFDDASVNDYKRLKEISSAFANAVKQKRVSPPENSSEEEPCSDVQNLMINDEVEPRTKTTNVVNKIRGVAEIVVKKTQVLAKDAAATIEKAGYNMQDKIVEGIDVINETVQGLQTKTVDKSSFINDVKDFLNERQGSFTDSLDMDYKNALEKLCDDISAEFSNNIDRYHDRVRGLREDWTPLSKLAVYIEKLSGDVEKAGNEIKGF